jgi:hypothetical protein
MCRALVVSISYICKAAEITCDSLIDPENLDSVDTCYKPLMFDAVCDTYVITLDILYFFLPLPLEWVPAVNLNFMFDFNISNNSILFCSQHQHERGLHLHRCSILDCQHSQFNENHHFASGGFHPLRFFIICFTDMF